MAVPGHPRVKAALLGLLADADREGFGNVRVEALHALGSLVPAGDFEVLSAVAPLLLDANCYTQKAAAATILQLVDATSRQPLMALLIEQLGSILENETWHWRPSFDLLATLATEADDAEVEILVGALLPLLKAWDPDVQRSATETLLPLVLSESAAASIRARLCGAGFLVPPDILQEIEQNASEWIGRRAAASQPERD